MTLKLADIKNRLEKWHLKKKLTLKTQIKNGIKNADIKNTLEKLTLTNADIKKKHRKKHQTMLTLKKHLSMT